MSQDDMPMKPDEISENDKLLVLLAYVFSPLVPVIILLMEDKKNRPFIRAHNAQALVLGLIGFIFSMVITSWLFVLILPCFISLGLFIYSLYCGFRGFQGEMVTIPVITDFVKGQGWA